MPFNSFNFWLIFPFIFSFYWLIPSRYVSIKKWYLIVVSYLLYMNWKPAFAIALLGVTLITFWGAEVVSKTKDSKKGMIWIFALLSFLPLIVFKYYNFINDTCIQCLESIGLHFALPGLNWAVPVGISFFTFQAVGYLFDVYYQRIKPEESITDYILFVSFFPQVTSGPISKASELLPQIKNPQPFKYSQGVDGLKLLLWGMFIKLVVADRLGLYVDVVYSNYIHYSGYCCLLASIFYTFQIYGDFAGYSLMAMGIAKALGYDIINNFRQPYLSVSVTDFWRRWHISLSRWLKDYIYIPMGGSRCSKLRNYWNILVTFLVSGIWHGANWTFIVWGVIHGVSQIIEKALGWQHYDSKNTLFKALRIFVTFSVVSFAWIFFRMPSLHEAVLFIGRIFTDFNSGMFLTHELTSIKIGLPILILYDLIKEYNLFKSYRTTVVKWSVCVALFVMILLIGVLDSGQFIYVSF